MKTDFLVEILSFNKIEEIPGAWKEQDYVSLLQLMDFSDTEGLPEGELRELTLMSLTDHDPVEAAEIVLSHIFGPGLNQGQREQIANEMLQEKMWEEYADLSKHEDLFNANQLLFQAFNGKFPPPEAVMFRVRITVRKLSDLDIFESNAEAAMIQLLVGGMAENTVISRLFGTQINTDNFPEASGIIWKLTTESEESHSFTSSIISSMYWFRELKYIGKFEVTLHGDL